MMSADAPASYKSHRRVQVSFSTLQLHRPPPASAPASSRTVRHPCPHPFREHAAMSAAAADWHLYYRTDISTSPSATRLHPPYSADVMNENVPSVPHTDTAEGAKPVAREPWRTSKPEMASQNPVREPWRTPVPAREPWRTTRVDSTGPQVLPQSQAMPHVQGLVHSEPQLHGNLQTGMLHSEPHLQPNLLQVVHSQMQGQIPGQMQPHLLAHSGFESQSPPRTPESAAVHSGSSATPVGGSAKLEKKQATLSWKKAKGLGVMSAGIQDAGPSFTCVHCAERFRSRGDRKQHIRTMHSKPHGCTECNSSFSRKFDLEKHRLTVHRGERPYSCEMCELSFGQKHHLVRHHRAVHTKARDFGCKECGADFARKEHLANHVRSVHEKAKPFLCLLCDAVYSEKRGLRRHYESTHTVKQSRAAVLATWQPEAKDGPSPIDEILKL